MKALVLKASMISEVRNAGSVEAWVAKRIAEEEEAWWVKRRAMDAALAERFPVVYKAGTGAVASRENMKIKKKHESDLRKWAKRNDYRFAKVRERLRIQYGALGNEITAKLKAYEASPHG